MRIYPRPAEPAFQQAIACRDLECLIWPFHRDRQGRGRITRQGKVHQVHSVVCEAVHGPRPSSDYDASHLCENGSSGCVNGSHIVWETKQANYLRQRGKAGRRKLVEKDIHEIRAALSRGEQQVLIAARYNVHNQTVSSIKLNKTWGWLT